MPHRTFTLPPASREGHTLVIAPSAKGKSLVPDNSELTMDLATRAFELIGSGEFSVSASLAADNPESLRNFGLLQSILLMAYQQGALDAQASKVKVVFAGSDRGQFAKVAVSEAEALLANANLKVVLPRVSQWAGQEKGYPFSVWIDVEANQADLGGAFSRALQRDPFRIVFVGSAPAYETQAREAGLDVDVLPSGTQIPPGANEVLPLPGRTRRLA